MPVDAATADQYFQSANQQQALYTHWIAAGERLRAYVAMDAANWYYLQLGIPYYTPADDPAYTPNPRDPAATAALAAVLPFLNPAEANRSATADTRGTTLQRNAVNALLSGYQPGWLGDYCDMFPGDSICKPPGFSLWGGFPPEQGGGGTISTTTIVNVTQNVTIEQTGLTLGDVATRIAGALNSAAAAIAGAVDLLVLTALKGIQHALTALGNELISVFAQLSRLAGLILKFLQGLLLNLIHGIVAALHALGRMLKDVFQNVLVPALQALQRLRNYLIKIYERFLRPLLIVLQDVRKVLAILKAFHIGFAEKLDRVLADVQSKISTPLLYLLRYTNAIANYINLILDARLFIQKPLFLASLNAYKGSTINLLINSMNPKPDADAIAALLQQYETPSPKKASAQFDQFLTSGTGQIAFDIAEPSAKFDVYLKQGVS